MIRIWLKTCLETHDRCRKPETSPSYIPTHVLEIDYPESTHIYRLVEGSTCPPYSKYVTLSHCWGESPDIKALRLSTSILKKICDKQFVSTSPKTFNLAMNVAQCLGIPYVWIDRLCIYQDSARDWRQEASSMRYVYRNAFFCIPAMGADNDDEGLFLSVTRPRSPGPLSALDSRKMVIRGLFDLPLKKAGPGNFTLRESLYLDERGPCRKGSCLHESHNPEIRKSSSNVERPIAVKRTWMASFYLIPINLDIARA